MKSIKRAWRPAAAAGVLILTVSAFVYYFATHPAVRQQLGRVAPWQLALILALYLASIIALALANLAILRLCRVGINNAENFLVTAYSAVVNFFGPLQSGPAFRAVYLKKRFSLNLKHYAGASLVYYFFWGVFSGLMLLSGLLKWWLIALAAAAILFAWLERHNRRIAERLRDLNLSGWYLLALATMAQVLAVALIYYVELRAVAPGTSLSQAVIYTGAANLAMFVSLTPGAIGFRESFLLFSQRLHHIGPGTIVAANIIDRAMYIVLLVVLALLIAGMHARGRLIKTVKD